MQCTQPFVKILYKSTDRMNTFEDHNHNKKNLKILYQQSQQCLTMMYLQNTDMFEKRSLDSC